MIAITLFIVANVVLLIMLQSNAKKRMLFVLFVQKIIPIQIVRIKVIRLPTYAITTCNQMMKTQIHITAST